MDTEVIKKGKVLNRDVIKYIAMFTMLLNHIANVFLTQGTWICQLFINLGYFTAITMCYFLVEGYHYTHSKRKYGLRLLVFALISEIPFCLALTGQGIIEFYGLNMIFTLCLCFLIIRVVERKGNIFLKVLSIIGIILLSTICDWAILAPIFTLLFIWAGNSQSRTKTAFLLSALLFGLFNFLGGIGRFAFGTNVLYAAVSMSGIILSGICIVYLYNKKRMESGRTFSKWFFYIFYPAHLLILGIIRIAVT